MKKSVLIFICLVACTPLFSQEKQSNCCDTVSVLINSAKTLTDSINSLNDTIKMYREFKSAKKQVKLKEIEKEKNLLSQQLRDTIKAKNEIEQTYRKQLQQKQEELDLLQAFKKRWIAQMLEEQKATLNRSFTELTQEELTLMHKQCDEVKDEKGINELIKQIEETQTNLDIYTKANKAVNTRYNADSVKFALQKIGSMNPLQLPQAQKEDMLKLTNQLNNYANSVKKFKSIISYFNKQLKVQRGGKNAASCKERLEELYKDVIEYEQQINQIPYLNRLFQQYRNDLATNPLVNSSVEAEINNTEL